MTDADSNIETCPRHRASRSIENVLILQGGGSLGAFSCGVFKGMYDNGVRFETVGGTSIGAVNAAIICGSKDDNPAKALEDFWMEIAESSYQIIPDTFFPNYDYKTNSHQISKVPSSILNSIIFGVPGFFKPRWQQAWFGGSLDDEILPSDWTYYYDHSPLAHTLEKYVDFGKLSRKKARPPEKNDGTPRLIATAVNIMTAESLVFDSSKMDIMPKHILASSAYSAYGLPWIEVDDNVYAWDGSLLSNTPLKEVIESSPVNDKNVYIVENYPRKIDRLPRNRAEVIDRTRDIIFGDKTVYDVRAWKHISRQTELIEKLYDIIEKNVDSKAIDPSTLEEIKTEYASLVGRYGAEILAIHRISRNRMESPHILKNADFSPKTIRDLIRQGEMKAAEHLKGSDEGDIAELLKNLYL
jgi:NTE family protein